MHWDKSTDWITLTPADHKYTMIFLHGLGDSARGFADVFMDERLNIAPDNCKVVLPTAPVQPVTLNGGMAMTSWFDVLDVSHHSGGPPTLKDVQQRYDQS